MGILDKALMAATLQADPKMVKAKREAQGEHARDLYAMLADLSGRYVRVGGQRCKLNVVLGMNAAHLNMDALDKRVIKTAKGREIRWKDTGQCVDGYSLWHDGTVYRMKRKGGPELEFAEKSEMETELAAQIGQIIEV